MKIVSWNANSKFREKNKEVLRLNADVYVIQECENPATCKDAEYCKVFANAFWVGQYNHKGLMIFTTQPDLKLERLNWPGEDKRYFIPVRVNDQFTLVGAWACDPYCEELFDWVEAVKDKLNEETIIIGDLNSNVLLDAKHIKKSGKSFGRVLQTLSALGIEDMWHYHHKEEQGKESTPTFYLYRHLDKPFHIDHCLANINLVTDIKIHARWQWLSLSDHLPVEIEVYIDETDNKPIADITFDEVPEYEVTDIIEPETAPTHEAATEEEKPDKPQLERRSGGNMDDYYRMRREENNKRFQSQNTQYAGNGYMQHKLMIHMPDRSIISNKFTIDSVIEFINKVGIDKVAELDLKIKNFYGSLSPLVTQKDKTGVKSYKKTNGGWYVFSNASYARMGLAVNEIAERLNIRAYAELALKDK